MEWTPISYHCRMSRGGTSGMPESPTILMTGRGSTPTRLRGSHPAPRKGSGLVMSLKSRWMEEGPTSPHSSRVWSCIGFSLSLSGPTRR
jgi:hypothetical protein